MPVLQAGTEFAILKTENPETESHQIVQQETFVLQSHPVMVQSDIATQWPT